MVLLLASTMDEELTETLVEFVSVVDTMETGCCDEVAVGVVGGLSGIIIGASLVVEDTAVTLVWEWGMGMESGTEVRAKGTDC